ncbi:hypothetical protein [Burkholderia arboris]|uniref:Uncharacterized protein n=1 Tax=Burkholderia arboris TaxID=488730 RepID=A0A9Q9SGN4_9BURK|nr:hypothetical protein [Burkholderia arboris]MCA8489482.1 hypothetical protein [Burkholderia arboris]VWB46996.1 hypothetical protein BAR24066_02119 [Burkholderia arboris]
MSNVTILESQLFNLCREALSSLTFLNVNQKAGTSTFEADDLIPKLIRILSLGKPPKPASTSSNNDMIGFSLFTAWFIMKVSTKLGSGFELRTELHKKSVLKSSFKSNIESYAKSAKIKLIPSELLVDFFISPEDKKHCPILTAESESKEDLKFHDLSKLLLTTSPRRIYLANIGSSSISPATSAIQHILDEANGAGILNTGDQIVFVLYEKNGKNFVIHLFDYDQYRHL